MSDPKNNTVDDKKTVVNNYYYSCVFRDPVPIFLKPAETQGTAPQQAEVNNNEAYKAMMNKIATDANCSASLVEYIVKLYEEYNIQ